MYNVGNRLFPHYVCCQGKRTGVNSINDHTLLSVMLKYIPKQGKRICIFGDHFFTAMRKGHSEMIQWGSLLVHK